MITLLQTLIDAAPHITRQLLESKTMTACKQITDALRQITDSEPFGFYTGRECQLIERLLEITSGQMNSAGVADVKAKLHGAVFDKSLGVEVVKNGGFISVFGPGVLKHV